MMKIKTSLRMSVYYIIMLYKTDLLNLSLGTLKKMKTKGLTLQKN